MTALARGSRACVAEAPLLSGRMLRACAKPDLACASPDADTGSPCAWCRYAGVPFDADALDIRLGPIGLMAAGQPLEFDAKAASAYLKDTTAVHGTVHIDLRLGDGPGAGVAWGCDLSYDYVKINAEYTT